MKRIGRATQAKYRNGPKVTRWVTIAQIPIVLPVLVGAGRCCHIPSAAAYIFQINENLWPFYRQRLATNIDLWALKHELLSGYVETIALRAPSSSFVFRILGIIIIVVSNRWNFCSSQIRNSFEMPVFAHQFFFASTHCAFGRVSMGNRIGGNDTGWVARCKSTWKTVAGEKTERNGGKWLNSNPNRKQLFKKREQSNHHTLLKMLPLTFMVAFTSANIPESTEPVQRNRFERKIHLNVRFENGEQLRMIRFEWHWCRCRFRADALSVGCQWHFTSFVGWNRIDSTGIALRFSWTSSFSDWKLIEWLPTGA